jgi:hypothetical protein
VSTSCSTTTSTTLNSTQPKTHSGCQLEGDLIVSFPFSRWSHHTPVEDGANGQTESPKSSLRCSLVGRPSTLERARAGVPHGRCTIWCRLVHGADMRCQVWVVINNQCI